MYLTGFADEASKDINDQIQVTKELGWEFIESRGVGNKNLVEISEDEFDIVENTLNKAEVKINCFGSAIANWAKKITDDTNPSLEETDRAIVRMKRLGTKMIRIMSYALIPNLPPEEQLFDKRVEWLKVIVGKFRDADLIPVHENCMNYGGMGSKYTLQLIEKIPEMGLVFDTGNPVFTKDYESDDQNKKQSAWEFYSAIKNKIDYVHIKDGCFDEEKQSTNYTFPGEGDGDVERIVKDLLDNGYQGGFSMEPHMQSVHHDESSKVTTTDAYQNYLEYGKRFMKLLEKTGHPIENMVNI